MKEFTLSEAQRIIPRLAKLLEHIRKDLTRLTVSLKKENERLLEVEWELRQKRLAQPIMGADVTQFDADPRWQTAAASLANCKSALREETTGFLGRLDEMGVHLRDLRSGLVDFPGRLGDAEVFWCWRLGEASIDHWHKRTEGFADRKPITSIPLPG